MATAHQTIAQDQQEQQTQEQPVDYRERTVEELRDLLRERNLQVSGSKDELVTRLMESDTTG